MANAPNASIFEVIRSINGTSEGRIRYAPTLTVERSSTFWGSIFGGTLQITTFSSSHTYPAYFPGLGRGPDFLLPSFLVSRQGPYRGREVFPGTFLRWILYSSLFFDPFFSFHTYPVNFPGLGRGLDFLLPSFLVSRQEKKVGAWGRSPHF